MDKLLVWDITSSCNLRCRHCYNGDLYFRNKIFDLTLEEKKDMLKKMSKLGFRYLSLLGGEPLICEGLDEILQVANQCELKVFITSNGTIMTDEIIEILLRNKVDTVLVSLEGAAEHANDAIRGVGSFQKATENIRKLINRIEKENSDMIVGISTTLTKSNSGELKKMPELANALGVKKLLFSSFVESGNGENNVEELKMDYNEIQNIIEDIAREEFTKYPNLQIQLDVRPYLTQYLARKYVLNNLMFVDTFTDCLAGEDMWYMTSYGDVHPCNVLLTQKIGENFPTELIKVENVNIRNCEEFNDKFDSEYFASFINVKKSPTNRSTCQTCDLKERCTPCPVTLWNIDKIEECEYIMKKEMEYHNSLMEKIPVIKECIVYKELNGEIVFWNTTNMRSERFCGIKNEIIKLIIDSKSIGEIGSVLLGKYDNLNKKNDIFNFLLDLRLDGYLSF